MGLDRISDYNPETVHTMSETGIGPLADFTVKYLTAITDVTPMDLEHSSLGSELERNNKKYNDLFEVLGSYMGIIDTCETLVHLDVNADVNREELQKIISKYVK
jgi:hypothetical protein